MSMAIYSNLSGCRSAENFNSFLYNMLIYY